MKEEHIKEMKGIVFDIQKYSLHDGQGIRTLVFMKGCPLRCLWCSNPESQEFLVEIGSLTKNCIQCGNCIKVCTRQAIRPTDYHILWTACNNCLECARVCGVKAKQVIGMEMTVDELIEIVEKDRVFYKNSGGGVTVGGGEPAAQSDFVSAFLYACKTLNISTSIETCGCVPWDEMKKTAEFADVIHFDIKHMDTEKHCELTGMDNNIILENAVKLGAYKDIIIRVPVIPGMNDDTSNLTSTIRFASDLPKLVRMELLPYHNLGEGKYDWVGKEYLLKDMKTYSKEEREGLINRIDGIEHDIDIRIV